MVLSVVGVASQVGRAMYAKAGELGLPVGHMPFKGFLLHVDEIEQLLQQYPTTKAIIDHCGFCQCDNLQSEEWQRLLALAKYPQASASVRHFANKVDCRVVAVCKARFLLVCCTLETWPRSTSLHQIWHLFTIVGRS